MSVRKASHAHNLVRCLHTKTQQDKLVFRTVYLWNVDAIRKFQTYCKPTAWKIILGAADEDLFDRFFHNMWYISVYWTSAHWWCSNNQYSVLTRSPGSVVMAAPSWTHELIDTTLSLREGQICPPGNHQKSSKSLQGQGGTLLVWIRPHMHVKWPAINNKLQQEAKQWHGRIHLTSSLAQHALFSLLSPVCGPNK